MGCIHTYKRLFDHPRLAVGDYRCTGLSSGRETDEWAPSHEIVFVRRGAFEKTCGRSSVLADATRAVFFPANHEYRVRHPVRGGDECTVLSLSDAALRDIIDRHDPRRASRAGDPFSMSTCPMDASLHLKQWELYHTLKRGSIDPAAVYESALSLGGEVIATAFACAGSPPLRAKPATQHAHRSLAQAVVELLNAEFNRPLTIDGIAARVHSSPYHMCHVFRRQTGQPVHRYLNRLRLRAAIDRLAEGERDLSALALDLGFSSGGHFGYTFRREFSTTPSAVRRSLTR